MLAAFFVASLSLAVFPRWVLESSLQDRLLAAAGSTLLLLLSILGHELGHALVAKRRGITVDGITIWIMGGVARLTSQPATPGAEFWIAAAGPLTNIVLAGVLGGIAFAINDASGATLAFAAITWAAAVNALLGVSNLFPASPLDGGRILTAILWRRSGDAEGARITSARVGFVVGVASVLAIPLIWWFTDALSSFMAAVSLATALLVLRGAVAEIASAVIRRRLATTSTAQLMVQHPPTVAAHLTVQDFLRFADQDPSISGFPVTRWGGEPIGYVDADAARSMTPEARSWTTLDEVMTPAPFVTRAWETESVSTVLDRLPADVEGVVVIHEPRDGRPIGTFTNRQVNPLFARPDPWGYRQ